MSNGPVKSISLHEECNYFAKKIFRKAVTAQFVDAYAKACGAILIDMRPDDHVVEAIIFEAYSKGVDIEAVELSLRITKGRNLLTQKLHILSFLAETDLNLGLMYRPKKLNLLSAFTMLSFCTVVSGYKFLKGLFYLRFVFKHEVSLQ